MDEKRDTPKENASFSGGVSRYLQQYAEEDCARFHMPGHKGRGKALHCASAWDITEIAGADNLLCPEGLLRRAQREAAAFFGAQSTFFLPGGSSQGMMASLLALPKDTKVYCSRDCHASLVSGLALSGHQVRFLPSRQGADGRPALLTAEQVTLALEEAKVPGQFPVPPKALVITRPDYFGRCLDIRAIVALCRWEDLILIVDEAHGAHFSLSPQLPESAIPWADLVFASAHKTLDAPNPAAYLHLGCGPFAEGLARVEQAARLVGSTSPSYPLLAALDEAWRGQEPVWEGHLVRLARWKDSLPSSWQQALQRGQAGEGVKEADPTRLCFDLPAEGKGSGHALESHLRSQGIVMEMADDRRVVGITSPLDPDDWYARLADALAAFPAQSASQSVHSTLPSPPHLPERACSVREAALAPSEIIRGKDPLGDALLGRVCARSVGAYPPGSALLWPGDRIDVENLAYLRALRDGGAALFGTPVSCVKE